MLGFLFLIFAFVHNINGSTVSNPHGIHQPSSHVVLSGDLGVWYHTDDHPVHRLFTRATDDGVDYPAVGSSEWSAPFPRSTPNVNHLPDEWVAALDDAVKTKKIPDIPRTTNTPQTNPVYPQGVDPLSPDICSTTYKCKNPDDIWDGPNGTFGISFDDGPQPATPRLLRFLEENDEKSTHFMIGVNILAYPQQFLATLNNSNDIAVHTWSHPYMTTLSNLEVVGQLGWTMELIRRSTGGRVPKFWRPPYGDSDNRIRAIAMEIFGLHTVIWNQDTSDWSLASGSTTVQAVVHHMEQWIKGPKSPGLVVLEHETSDDAVDAFIGAYPLVKSNGWNTDSLLRLLDNGDAYQNAHTSDSDDVVLGDILVNNSGIPNITSETSSVTTKPSASTTSASTAHSAPTTASTSSSISTNTAPAQSANSNSGLKLEGSTLFILMTAAICILHIL